MARPRQRLDRHEQIVTRGPIIRSFADAEPFFVAARSRTSGRARQQARRVRLLPQVA